MIPAPADLSWQGATAWLVAILVAGFLVSWLATDVWRLGRVPYIAVLSVVTFGLTAGYVAWAGLGFADVLTHHAGWGVIAGLVSGAFVALIVHRGFPADTPAPIGHAEPLGWECAVYGAAEGVLLSGLPALVAWHAADGLAVGLTTIAALLASVAMIAIHHFGYWDYRGRQVVPVIVGCSILTVGFLVTGSLIAPALGHAVMHTALLRNRVELPPHAHGARLTADSRQ